MNYFIVKIKFLTYTVDYTPPVFSLGDDCIYHLSDLAHFGKKLYRYESYDEHTAEPEPDKPYQADWWMDGEFEDFEKFELTLPERSALYWALVAHDPVLERYCEALDELPLSRLMMWESRCENGDSFSEEEDGFNSAFELIEKQEAVWNERYSGTAIVARGPILDESRLDHDF